MCVFIVCSWLLFLDINTLIHNHPPTPPTPHTHTHTHTHSNRESSPPIHQATSKHIDGGRLPHLDSLEIRDQFKDFDWVREEPSDEFSPRHSRGSSMSSLPRTSSPRHSFNHHGASASPKRNQQGGKISITSLPDPRLMKPHITVEDHSDGASAIARVSSDGRTQIQQRSPTHSPSPRRRLPRMSPVHSRSSSVGSTKSMQEMNDELSDLSMTINQASAATAKRRWKKAYDNQLPEIRKRISMREKTFPGLSGDGAITLVEL